MNAATGHGDSRVERLEQAALWLQRMHSAGADERIVEEWLEWCQRDPLNQQAFDEMAAVWESSGQLDAPARTARPTSPSRPQIRRRGLLAASLAGIALAAAGWWIWQPRSAAVLTADYASPIGANTTHTLADGSRLELGGATRVTVTMSARERRVALHEGELFVIVRPDAARPFLVNTGRLAVVATGTAFNVLRTLDRTTVTVAEGSVEARYDDADAASPNVQLGVSQQLVYSHAAHSVVVRQAEPNDVTAWRAGQLRFKQEPLSVIIATLNRYTPRTIVIEDPRVAARTFSGVVRVDDIDASMESLGVGLPFSIVELPDGRRLIGSRPGSLRD